ncbi:MAG: hypothetical protein ACHQZS_02835 [Candidatus Binatales bacterium]
MDLWPAFNLPPDVLRRRQKVAKVWFGIFLLFLAVSIVYALVAATADAYWHNKSLYGGLGTLVTIVDVYLNLTLLLFTAFVRGFPVSWRLLFGAFWASSLFVSLRPFLPGNFFAVALETEISVHIVFDVAIAACFYAMVRDYWRKYVSKEARADANRILP